MKTGHRWLAWAVVSVVAHLLVARIPIPIDPPVDAPEQVVAIELASLPAIKPKREPVPEPKPVPAPAPVPATSNAKPAPSVRRSAVRPPQRRPVQSPGPRSSRPNLPSSPKPAQRSASAAPLAMRRNLNLSWRDIPAPPKPRGATTTLTTPTSKQEARSVKHGIDRWLGEQRATEHVRSGQSHPILLRYMRNADALFKPTWKLTEGDATGVGSIGKSSAHFARVFVRGWLNRLEVNDSRYARTGDNQPLALEHYKAMVKKAVDSAKGLAAEVCINVGQGKMRPAVRRSSGRRDYDKMAIDALRKAVRMERWPKDAKVGRACYRFHTVLLRMPPLPYLACTFDEVLLKFGCVYPLKKIVHANVNLTRMYVGRR